MIRANEKHSHRFGQLLAVLGFLLLFEATPALSQNITKIYGYGSWAGGITDGNNYMFGRDEFSFNNSNYTLSISAQPQGKVSYFCQLTWRIIDDDVKNYLDYVFAEVNYWDWLKLRIGRIKQSFGIYTEIINVGTLRPFLMIPQSVYGKNGFTGVSFSGVGITGMLDLDSFGDLLYDTYLGAVENGLETPSLLFDGSSVNTLSFNIENAIGGKFAWATPLDGLTVGISNYFGDWDASSALEYGLVFTNEYIVGNAFLDYDDGKNIIRAEFVGSRQGKILRQKAGYIELARFYTKHIQSAIRYEKLTMDFDGLLVPPQYSSYLDPIFRHEGKAVGLNYWFTPAFVIKTEYQYVIGNRMAYPIGGDGLIPLLLSGQMKEKTQLFQIGADFSF